MSDGQIIAPGSILVLKHDDFPPEDEWEAREAMFAELRGKHGSEFIVVFTESGHVDALDDDGVVALVEARLPAMDLVAVTRIRELCQEAERG